MGRGISQSALTVYRKCPFAYKCYRERKVPLMFNQDVLDTGSLTHNTIDAYYKGHYLTEGTANDILYETYNLLKVNWDRTLPSEELHKAYTCLQHHAEWEATNINNGHVSAPLTEQKLSTDIFYGIIDYIDLLRNLVMDWKTGKYASLSHEYKIQALIYKPLFEENFKKPLEMFTFFFLYPNEFRTVYYKHPNMKKAIEEVEALKTAMILDIDNDEFEKKPRTERACNGCEYRIYCKI